MSQSEFWNKLKTRFKEVSTAAADFTEEQALIGKLKFEILTLKRRVDRSRGELGSLVCELSKNTPQPNVFDDVEVMRYLSEIEDTENQIEVKRKEITEVSDHFRAKAAEPKTESFEKEEDFSKPFEPPVEEVNTETVKEPEEKKAVKPKVAKKPKRTTKKTTSKKNCY